MPEISTMAYQAMGDLVSIYTCDSYPALVKKLHPLEKIYMDSQLGQILLYTDSQRIGTYQSLVFWTHDSQPTFKLHIGTKTFPYYDHLLVSAKGKSLFLINQVYIENYVKGVVSAEAGMYKALEFYKVQSLSARTYAMNNLQKHKKEGYDLCASTHCQVYNGIPPKNTLLDQAILETKGELIVYQDSILIDAVFSANCGGVTANSEDVWIKKIDYLRSIPDVACEGFSNHEWHVLMPRSEFINKLSEYYKKEVLNYTIVPDISGRVKRIVMNNDEKWVMSGESARSCFKLKSSRFHVYETMNLVFIEGTGFGHGVGLCQDGAYQLALQGFTYKEIIQHYYIGTDILQINEVFGGKKDSLSLNHTSTQPGSRP